MAAMPLAVAAGPAKGQSNRKNQAITVGDFAVMLAAATGQGPNLEAGKAVESLARNGVPIGSPVEILSQGRLARILDYYGVKVKTSTPDEAVTLSKAETALLAAATSLTVTAAAPSTQPDDACLDRCAQERLHGQCVNCCKECNGTSSTTCAHFCTQIKKGSASEPLP